MTTEMSDNETVDDVLADMLLPRFDAITAMRANNYYEIKSLVANYRDRIEAAYKRDVEKSNSVIQATVSRSDAETDRLRRERDTLQRERDELAKDYNNAQRERSIANRKLREMEKSVGNSAKLREAMEKARHVLHCATIAGILKGDDTYDALNMANTALAKPPRNCDVGTAEEQEVRFRNYCWNHSSRDKNMECQCPIDAEGKAGCKLTWAQMPYEELDTNK